MQYIPMPSMPMIPIAQQGGRQIIVAKLIDDIIRMPPHVILELSTQLLMQMRLDRRREFSQAPASFGQAIGAAQSEILNRYTVVQSEWERMQAARRAPQRRDAAPRQTGPDYGVRPVVVPRRPSVVTEMRIPVILRRPAQPASAAERGAGTGAALESRMTPLPTELTAQPPAPRPHRRGRARGSRRRDGVVPSEDLAAEMAAEPIEPELVGEPIVAETHPPIAPAAATPPLTATATE